MSYGIERLSTQSMLFFRLLDFYPLLSAAGTRFLCLGFTFFLLTVLVLLYFLRHGNNLLAISRVALCFLK